MRLPQRGNVLTEIDLDLTPYLKTPISLIGDYRVKWLGALAPTQSGKTVLLQTALADAIDQDPGNCLYVLPDEKMGKKHMTEKIIRVIQMTPDLAQHMTGRIRDMSKASIELDHMNVYPAWSNSLGSISSFPMKRVFLDEIRLMKLMVGQESNAIQLAEDRLTTYFDYGIGQGYMVSSPSVQGDLLHNQLDVHNTSVWFWQVPCPECGEYQALKFFTHIKWNEKKEKAECLCIHCGAEFKDDDKKKSWNDNGIYVRRILSEDGKWTDTKVTPDGEAEYPFKVTERMFFWWGSLVSPFRSFHRIWNKFIETKDKLHDYKNFIQCWEADFWIDDISKTSSLKLKEHRASYSKGDLPLGVKILFTGIDTQDDGFACVTRGFGENKFTAIIDEFFVPCQIEVASVADIVKVFKDIKSRIYTGPTGDKWMIALIGIDTGGHRTKEVYAAAASVPGIVLVKGQNTQNVRYTYNKELNLYLVRTHEYLDETETRTESPVFLLPKDVSDDFCMQYCNVRKIKDKNKKTGEEKIIWKKTGRCDYRFADIHTFICLDIPTDRGIMRHEIEKDGFSWNPFIDYKKIQRAALERNASNTNYEEQQNGFINVGSDW